jgi:cellulose synthase operon protein C
MLTINPVDVWSHREKAFKLGHARRLDEALRHAQTALELSPQSTQSHAAMGYVRWRFDDLDAARQHFKDALTISVDNEYALVSLIDIETTSEGRLAALQFIQQALLDQVTTGEGLLAFHEQARVVMDADALLSVLQHAHRERPDLWQCWAALSNQLSRMGKVDESLALLDQALQRFPMLPRLYTDKAQVLLLLQQRDPAREQLKQAMQLSPGWAWPVRLFVDSVGDEGHDLGRALPVLESALRRQPTHADLRGLHGWLQWRLGDVQKALAELKEAVSLDPGLRWAWDVLQRVAQEGQQPRAAALAAESVVQARPGDVLAWLRLSEFADTAERAMEAANHGISLEPRNQEIVEQRLRLLLQAQRYDEVLAYLRNTPWGEATPASVLAFKARVHRQRGEADQALASLREVLARHPDSGALWRELADWLDELGRKNDYLHAAQQLLRLAPQSALAHGYVGHALRLQGEVRQAERSLSRALALDPSYRFAALQLVDLHIELEQWQQAQSQLDALERYDHSPIVALRRAQCAAATRERQLTIDKALEVVTTPQIHPNLSRAAVDCVVRAQWSVYFAEAIEEALKKGPCSREAVRLWIEHQGDGWIPGAFYRDMRKALKNDPSDAVKHGLLLWLGEKKDNALLNRFVKDYDGDLRRHTESWSLAGYAYINQGRYADAARWMSDWESRKDIPSWSLDNIAYCFRKLGRHPEAAEATTWSLSIEPNNPEALVWLAFDAGRKGQLVELEQQLERLKGAEIRPYYAHLQRALTAYLNAARTHDSAAALWHFAQLQGEAQHDKVLRSLLKELARRLLAAHTPGWKRPWRWLQFQMGWS